MEHFLSYASTPSKRPVLYKTYVDMVQQWAELYPNKDAFVEYTEDGERKSLSCSELLAKAKTFGKYLIKSGLEKGGVVVICMKNSLNMVIAICGVYFGGGIVACTSPILQDGTDVIHFLNDTSTKHFVVDTDPSDSNWETVKTVLDSAKDLQLKIIICNGSGSVECEQMPGDLLTTFQNVMLENLDENDTFPVVLPEDPATYYKTSGSTGKSKLVVHAHFTCIENAYILNEREGIDSSSVYFCDRPFGWSGGCPRKFFASGSTRIFVDTSVTVGENASGFEMKIVDSSGHVVQKGDHGELYVRSIQRFSAYDGMPGLFHDVVDASSWYHTGDVGYIKEDGNFVLDGRTSEAITIASLKIFPFDVENEMLKCPGVEAAIAVPVPDARLTNVICACVILDKSSAASLDTVREFCEKKWVQRSHATGISLRPTYYLEMKQLVISTTGKLDRKQMAVEARNKLHL